MELCGGGQRGANKLTSVFLKHFILYCSSAVEICPVERRLIFEGTLSPSVSAVNISTDARLVRNQLGSSAGSAAAAAAAAAAGY